MADNPTNETAIMQQTNALMQQQLAMAREKMELNNRTAASSAEMYDKDRMRLEQQELVIDILGRQEELMLMSEEAQERRIQQLNEAAQKQEALSQAQQAELDILNESLRVRRQNANAYEKELKKIRQKKKAAEDARDAGDWGKNIANMMGFQKAQDGMIKKFMKSKNKIKMVTSAMRGFVSQISLAQVGTKIMQAGFQMFTTIAAKALGMGGGGAGRNLSEFVKQTGHADGQMHKLAGSMARLGRKLRVGWEEGAAAVGALMDKMPGFLDKSKTSQRTLAKVAVEMSAFGVDAEESAEMFAYMSHQMGMSSRDISKTSKQMFAEAQKLGIPISKFMGDFMEFTKAIPGLGSKSRAEFKKMAASAKALGVEVKTLTKMTKGFEDYEGAMSKAAEMNQVLGSAAFDGGKLMMTALENPGDMAKVLNEQLDEAGVNFNEMSRAQKLAMAEASGMEVGELENIMQGKEGLNKVQKAQNSINKVTNAVNKFNKALKKTKPPESGHKSFLSMVLKEYNAITGGLFRKKLGGARRDLKKIIRDAARFIACWIRKIESWFIDAATRFIDAFAGPIDTIGNFFGIDNASKKLKSFIQNLDGLGPVIIPVLVMASGLVLKIFGGFTKILGVLPGIVKGVAGFGKGLMGLPEKVKGIASAFKGTGSVTQKMSKAWDAMTGKASARSIENLAKEAKPVVVTNMGPGQAVPVNTAAGGGAAEEEGEGPIKKLLGGRGVKLAGLGLSAKAMSVAQSRAATTARGGTFGRLKQAFMGGKRGGGWKGGFKAAGKSGFRMMRTGMRGMDPRVMFQLKRAQGLMDAGKTISAGRGAASGAGVVGKAKGALGSLTKGFKGISGLGGALGGVGGKLMKGIPILGTALGAFGGVSKIIEGDFTGGVKDLAQGALFLMGPIGMAAGALWMAYDYFKDKEYPAMVDFNTALKQMDAASQKEVGVMMQLSETTKELNQAMEEEVKAIGQGNTHLEKAIEQYYGKSMSVSGDYKGFIDKLAETSDHDDQRKIEKDIAKARKDNNKKLAAMKKQQWVKELEQNKGLQAQMERDVQAGMDAHNKLMDQQEKALEARAKKEDWNADELAAARNRLHWQRTELTQLKESQLKMEALQRARAETFDDYAKGRKQIKEKEIDMEKQLQGREAAYLQFLRTAEAQGKTLTAQQQKTLKMLGGKEALTKIGFTDESATEAANKWAYEQRKKMYENYAHSYGAYYKSYDKFMEMRALRNRSTTAQQGMYDRRMANDLKAMEAVNKKIWDDKNRLQDSMKKEFVKTKQASELKSVMEKLRKTGTEENLALVTEFARGDAVKARQLLDSAEADLKRLADAGQLTRKKLLETLDHHQKVVFKDEDAEKERLKREAEMTKKKLEAQQWKVTQKDLDMVVKYKGAIAEFAAVLDETQIDKKFAPFLTAIQNLVDTTKGSDAKESSEFMENAGILFFNARQMGSSTAGRIKKVGMALANLSKKIDAGEFSQIATGLQTIAGAHVSTTSTNAVAVLEKANEQFPKFKKHVEDLESSLAGKLFFKGGKIHHKVDSRQQVTLKIGEREFGKAVLYGLDKEGSVKVDKLKGL